MKLIPDRPVTIERVRFGERWFPFLFRMPDGMLVMTIEYNFDTHWAPHLRMTSMDGGKTWAYPTAPVPRVAWCHGFADGELFELDTYGVNDPKTGESVFYGAWSHPARANDTPRKEFARFRGVTQRGQTLAQLRGCPTHPWWNLWNTLYDTDSLTGDEVLINGPVITSGVEMPDGRLLAAGYLSHCAVYESRDRGQTWDEVGIISDPARGGPDANETALQRLRDGRLYAIMRTEAGADGYGGRFTHAWSADEGRSWSKLENLVLRDEQDHHVGNAWPAMTRLDDGTLVLAYGRPGKHLIFDPSAAGAQWQGRLNLHEWELDTQALNGVPPEQRLRGVVGEDWSKRMDRHTDSGDYLGVAAVGPRELLVVYDVHAYVENWNAYPISGVRMARVWLEE